MGKSIKDYIKSGRISKDRVKELSSKSTDFLKKELSDGEKVCNDYYCNSFFIQKYEDDESFMKTGDAILAENAVIELILNKRKANG